MNINVTTLSAVIAILSIVTALIQRISTAAISTSSFRTRWFFRGRLADVTLALEHLPEARKGALGSMIDARIFRFMFGFYARSQMRNAIFMALESGQLSEGQVKACSWKLSLRDDRKLEIKPRRGEIFEAYFCISVCVLMFGTLILLIRAIAAEKQITHATLALGLATAVLDLALIFKMLSNFFDVLIVRSTRKQLNEDNKKAAITDDKKVLALTPV